jgi:glycolate oxidase FAD binding subunit
MAQAQEALIETPESPSDAAAVLKELGEKRLSLRPRGAGTKFDWGTAAGAEARVQLRTAALNEILEHNVHDMTAVLQSGVPLAKAQRAFASEGQMLALDPPLGHDRDATIGGVLSTGDSGPLRHRYKAGRDLVLGMTVAMSDGTLARAGSKVIKNVAGYDLAKLFTGSYGTLGLIVDVIVRLHPLPARTLTVSGATDDAHRLQQATLTVANATMEIEALDVVWRDEKGSVLAQFGGVAPEGQGETAREVMRAAGLEVEVHEQDRDLWAAQRAGQRSDSGAVVKVAALPTELARVIDAATEAGAQLVGRGSLGIYWLRLDRGEYLTDAGALVDAIGALRDRLAPYSCVVLDADPATRARLSVWGEPSDDPSLGLMHAIKARFDVAGVCAPGVFVEGI